MCFICLSSIAPPDRRFPTHIPPFSQLCTHKAIAEKNRLASSTAILKQSKAESK